MSAWPEAVWIIKKLQKNFDFSDKILEFATEINNINGRVNDLNTTLQNDKNNLNTAILNVKIMSSTIRDTKNSNNRPSNQSLDSYDIGTIWLVVNKL